MSNTLTGLIPTLYTALNRVSREQVGFIPAVARNAKADAAAKDQTVTAPVAPPTTTVDITPAATAPNDGDQSIGTVDVKITKSKMAPVKWNGEEQLAIGPSGNYDVILADQFSQAFRALSNEMDADLAALYYKSSRAVGAPKDTPFSIKDDLSDAALARQILVDNGSPTTDLRMVLGGEAKRPFVYDRQIQITDNFQNIGGGFCQIVYTGAQVRMNGGYGNLRIKGVVMSGGSVRSAYNRVFGNYYSNGWDMTRNRNITMPILILPDMY